VVLRDLLDLSYQDVAALTAVPVGTVKSRIHQARSALRLRLVPPVEPGCPAG
jgi:RNA polymerase sigma-70 factor (ECF subfamily)